MIAASRKPSTLRELVEAGAQSWRSLTPELLSSICRCEYIERGDQD